MEFTYRKKTSTTSKPSNKKSDKKSGEICIMCKKDVKINKLDKTKYCKCGNLYCYGCMRRVEDAYDRNNRYQNLYEACPCYFFYNHMKNDTSPNQRNKYLEMFEENIMTMRNNIDEEDRYEADYNEFQIYDSDEYHSDDGYDTC